jgi:hypothetical protein
MTPARAEFFSPPRPNRRVGRAVVPGRAGWMPSNGNAAQERRTAFLRHDGGGFVPPALVPGRARATDVVSLRRPLELPSSVRRTRAAARCP